MRPIHPLLASAMLLGLGLAGCLGQSEAGSPSQTSAPAARPAEFDETTGAIDGLVHDDTLAPLANASIAFLDLPNSTTVSDLEGKFTFSRLPPGTHKLAAQKLGYDAVVKAVVVEAGRATSIDLTLTSVAVVEPYMITKNQRGLFGCGATWRPAVGVSGIAACGVLSGEPLNLTQYDKFLLNWEISGNVSEWDGAAFEMSWVTNQAFGRGLTMIWEVRGCANVRNSTFARAAGASPLHVTLNESLLDEKRANNTEKSTCNAKANCNQNQCKMYSRVFSSPDTLGASSPADVGITLQQPFTQYLTEFYNLEAPPGYSAIGDV